MAKQPFTKEYLKSLLDYNPDTGIFVWKERIDRLGRSNVAFNGKIAGRENRYWEIRINYTRYGAHRLAWLYIHDKWPPNDIGHINGIKTDNRISNLRLATRSQNMSNKSAQKNNKLGIKGVRIHCKAIHKKYQARIRVMGKEISLGYYHTIEEAIHAYGVAAKKFFGEFSKH